MRRKVAPAARVLYSHRRHGSPFSDGRVELDRVVAPSWLVRRARFHNVVRDERLTRPLLERAASTRASLTIVMAGSAAYFVDGRELTLFEGEVLVTSPPFAPLIRCTDTTFIEVEWDAREPLVDPTRSSIERMVLSPETMDAAVKLATLVRVARPDSPGPLAAGVRSFFELLAEHGIRLDVDAALRDLEATTSESDQRLCDELDRVLSHLEEGPGSVSLEGALGCSRRTLQRKTQSLCRRYLLEGRAADDWRTIHNSYRLLIGAMFATHSKITTRTLASMLGYASPQALCHAFARVGLPSPSALRDTWGVAP